jgi:hypothetical protein
MSVFDLFSKRQKRLRGEVPDVYFYDKIPYSLRVQIIHIWDYALGNERQYAAQYRGVQDTYDQIVKILCCEYGVFGLKESNHEDYNKFNALKEFFLSEQGIEKVLDVIELSFKAIDRYTRNYDYWRTSDYNKIVDSAISDLNTRFKEHRVGYQYENGEIVRVDSQLLHSETVKPALKLLNSKEYAGAQQEFLSSYEHYRHGKQKEALNDALKSFESTMKAICDKRSWKYNNGDTSNRLIEICYENGLIPSFWQQEMSGLRALLEGGVPAARNKLSGHGQGSQITKVPDHIVGYVLHMTAAAIVFLVRSENEST